MIGCLALVASTVSYALGLLAQSAAARRADLRAGLDVTLLGRLATDRVYLLGFAAQIAGFGFAFVARATLPLYLVQAGACASVGLAALAGAAVLRWRVTRAELGVLGVMTLALVLLAGAAEPAPAGAVGTGTAWLLAASLAGCAVLAVPATRSGGGVALAALAGAAFAILAVASRPIASLSPAEWLGHPLTWLTVAAAALGQALLAAALQRGSTIAAGASMDAVTMVVSASAGLLLLGDRITAGRGWWVAVGLVAITAGVLVLARVGTVVSRPPESVRPEPARPEPSPTSPSPTSAGERSRLA